MKNIKKAIIIILIIIAILLITIFAIILNNKNNNTNNTNEIENNITNTNETNEISDNEATSDNISDNTNNNTVKNYNMFYTIEKCINQYYNSLNTNNSAYFVYDESENNYVQVVSDEDIAENTISLLDTTYINNNNINNSNLYNYINKLDTSLIYTTLKMNYFKNNNIESYIAYGFLSNSNDNLVSYNYIIVNIDKENSTFSVIPVTNNYNDINEINFPELNYDSIQPNEYNKYNEENLNTEDICRNYFVTYKKLLKINPDYLYNCFSKKYKEKRFKTFDMFNNYINENQEEIQNAKYSKYLLTGSSYICKDQYDNIYSFNATSPMNFTLELDDYTILTDNFKNRYSSSDTKEKINENVGIFIKMINNKDYTSIYNILEENYKNNNFSSEEDFINYIKNNYPEHYTFEVKNVTETDENGKYNVNVNLINIDDTESTSEKNMSITLSNEYEFYISF